MYLKTKSRKGRRRNVNWRYVKKVLKVLRKDEVSYEGEKKFVKK